MSDIDGAGDAVAMKKKETPKKTSRNKDTPPEENEESAEGKKTPEDQNLSEILEQDSGAPLADSSKPAEEETRAEEGVELVQLEEKAEPAARKKGLSFGGLVLVVLLVGGIAGLVYYQKKRMEPAPTPPVASPLAVEGPILEPPVMEEVAQIPEVTQEVPESAITEMAPVAEATTAEPDEIAEPVEPEDEEEAADEFEDIASMVEPQVPEEFIEFFPAEFAEPVASEVAEEAIADPEEFAESFEEDAPAEEIAAVEFLEEAPVAEETVAELEDIAEVAPLDDAPVVEEAIAEPEEIAEPFEEDAPTEEFAEAEPAEASGEIAAVTEEEPIEIEEAAAPEPATIEEGQEVAEVPAMNGVTTAEPAPQAPRTKEVTAFLDFIENLPLQTWQWIKSLFAQSF